MTAPAIESHPLQPFLPPSARVLMLGSFPPPRRRWCMDFFYPNYLNDMWRIVGLVFMGDKDAFVDVAAKRFRHQTLVDWLSGQGLAFYDTACRVRRLQGNASDKFLEIVTPTDIDALVDRLPLCTAIAATGQKSAETLAERYGIKPPAVGQYVDIDVAGRNLRFYRMPSTSRAYPAPLAAKAAAYEAMWRAEGLI